MQNINKFILLTAFIFSFATCEKANETNNQQGTIDDEKTDDPLVEGVDFFLPNIDLSHWKVTLPIGSPTEVEPPDILDYANNDLLKNFMFNDSLDGALVFHTYPGATTANAKYSRTELREQMEAGNNNVNWTFAQGGTLRGKLSVAEISKDADGDFDRTIIMQIHGRLTNEQRDNIAASDNNAPPVLKIYWQKGFIRVKTKILKDPEMTDPLELLQTDSWTDDEGYYFTEKVDHEVFTLEIDVREGRMEITLNDQESKVYEGINMDKWGIFENYFKAGNYLQSTDPNSFATVKYYELTVDH